MKRTFCGRSTLASIAGLAGCIGFACVAAGEEKAASDSTPASAVAAAPVPGTPSPSIATSFPAIADPAGIRSALAAKGIQFGVNYIGDVFGNLTGGSRRGTVYEGRLELVIDADLEKLAGWQGGSFHANAYQIHGAGLSRYFIGNLMATSNIEALASTRLYETWVEQKLFDGKFALRAGQLGADSEFITSTNAGLFLNSTFGWPQITASDLPSGGPAYPLATPGARAKLAPNDNLALLVGVFNGDPAGRGVLDPQKRNRYGLDFRLSDPPFVIGEGQYKYGSEPGASGLPGTLKIG
ncbi:MAG: carbohydrate porin, partial [Methylobacteriaceae bacterium]|nr:carbohydrate porin [Methylobacteriaceae bacterium]